MGRRRSSWAQAQALVLSLLTLRWEPVVLDLRTVADGQLPDQSARRLQSVDRRLGAFRGVQEELRAGVTGEAERFDCSTGVAGRKLLAIEILVGRRKDQVERFRLDFLRIGNCDEEQGGEGGEGLHLELLCCLDGK